MQARKEGMSPFSRLQFAVVPVLSHVTMLSSDWILHSRSSGTSQATHQGTKKNGVVTQDTALEEKYEHQHFEFFEEDKIALRKRAHKCMALLAESGQEAVAAVTHKGYLRELERGLFGMEDATEFDNCEIRVYKLLVSTLQQKLVEAERIMV